MIDTARALGKILPPPGLPRALAAQNALWGVGTGTFLAGSVVFYSLYVGLTPVQIGVGLSAAGFVALVGSMPLGHLADRIGGRQAWAIGAVVRGVAFAVYPLAHGFWPFLLLMCVQTTAETLSTSGRVVYTAAAVPAESRVRVMAFNRAYLNVGWSVGAGLGAGALALDSRPGLLLLVFIAAAASALNGLSVARMPRVAPAAVPDGPRPSPWGVLRDLPYTAGSAVFGVLWLHAILWNDVLQLWVITRTDVPKPVLGGLVALNTVLAVVFQVRATRGADTMPGVVRLTRAAALSAAVACPVAAATGMTHGWLTVALLLVAVILFTGTELWVSAAQWFVQVEVPPAAQRGLYVGLDKSVQGVTRLAGPAGLTFLVIQSGGWGWWVIAGIFAGCAVAVRPVMAWIERTPRTAELPARSP
ncbi:MFS transporter [Actinoplanes teichomyceticus]|uniref:MFS transporter n=1 Tax=Actinoplanes teichomyceticus TaxID=1867 RepID=A0A561WC66_ACTTI|nr:MFS transporter [Actinoplanes teichomyceticus]TWG21461.1 MFS transporter [Actinoplanes teichomyceticus]GIF16565.1 MFS transporter [Actinoplanes teichomyceticus]